MEMKKELAAVRALIQQMESKEPWPIFSMAGRLSTSMSNF